MDKKTSAGLLAIGLALIVLSWSFSNNRYALVRASQTDDAVFYKLDQRTGRIWLIDGTDIEKEVSGPRTHSQPAESPEQMAIRLAKEYIPPGQGSDMDSTIRNWLQSRKGSLRVFDWTARKIDDQTYLVGYSYDAGPDTQNNGWFFEVNTNARIVRNVIGDQELETKYKTLAANIPSANKR